MSNAERADIGLCAFSALVVAYHVFVTREGVLIVIYSLLLVILLLVLLLHRRQRQQRGRDDVNDR